MFKLIPATSTEPSRRCKHIPDEAFVDALDFTFRDVTTIARHMLANSTPATLRMIRARMKEFVDVGGIDTADDSWRITPAMPIQPPRPANDVRHGLALNTVHHGDCLDLMRDIPDQSVNLVLCDLPYGTCGARSKAGNAIDVPLDLERLWREYRRMIAPGGNILLFASQPFSTDLINAARDLYRYSNIWRKDHATGHNHARNKPLKDYEEVLLFSPSKIGHAHKGQRSGATRNRSTFNPWQAREVTKRNSPRRNEWARYAPDIKAYPGRHDYVGLENCPRMVMEYPKERQTIHPYQKPIALLDDLIRTYSNADDVVLDNCAGSGSTAIAAIGAGRRWIAIEQAEDIVEDARTRIAAVAAQERL